LAYIAITLLHRQVKRGCGAGSAAPQTLIKGTRLADLAQLHALVEPEARALGFDLVRVKLFGGGDDRTLQVMAERPDTRQLTIDDCSELSRRLSDKLDALEEAGKDPIEGAYRLEVSSPGIDRPLTRLADFADWQSHEARVVLAEKRDGQKVFKGDLSGIRGEDVILATDKGEVTLPFAAIADAKLVFTDRLVAATKPLSIEGADDVVELSADADGEEAADDAETEELK
jgi:ribosome maturation factor RimP